AKAIGFKPGDDRCCLPHQPPLPEPPSKFPLLLLPVEILPLAGGSGAHLPYLQQIAGPHVFEHWESWVEMNPGTARQLGLADRDWVWVESQRGRVRVRLRLYAGARADVVHLPLGYGRAQGSSWGRRGVNPLSLVELEREPLTGLLQTTRTYVRVYRS
ncbi:MAG TPA: molybdopterin dinucleotide binding domain-containing protein, partial [Dehalococcoidia bacterium]|nr:molybdopterin dinucleotide binding domain-containing protein [Dehalococcoidia bacterium]